MTDKKIIVSKANDLIAASYTLTVREQRLLLAAISLIFPKGEMPKEIIVTADYYNSIFNVTNPYRDMTDAAKRLFERFLVFENDLEHGRVHWLSEIGSAKNHGHVRVVFTEGMLPYLSLLTKRFSSYDIRRIAKLSSVYAIRIFEMLIQFRTTGIFNIGLEALKSRLDLPPSYNRLNNFRAKVLDSAIADINEHTGLRVVYEIIYEGRVATAVTFRFSDSWITYPALTDGKGKGADAPKSNAGTGPGKDTSQNDKPESDSGEEEPAESELSAEELIAKREDAREHMNKLKQLLGQKIIRKAEPGLDEEGES
jgi:plasmid replication initiation protein